LKPALRSAICLFAVVFNSACSGRLDAGSDVVRGPLPVDNRSATVVVNDGAMDNWQGEYAALFAASGQLKWVGLVVNSNTEYPSVDTNVNGFRDMIAAARDSGMRGLPDPTASIASKLARPASGVIEDTVPNHSEGARLIVEAAASYGTAVHPLAIATGGALTDVADAYLLDPTLAERAVVVASLGQNKGSGAVTGDPNGNRDPWATYIVTTRLRYVQVNGYYDQLLDIPDDRVAELPDNAFGRWLSEKRSNILSVLHACDQVSVLSIALPWFDSDVTRLRLDDTDSTTLVGDPNGPIWHVTKTDSDRAREDFWTRLKDPQTYR